MNDIYERIIDHALDKNVSDIHIQVGKTTIIYFRDQGKLIEYDSFDKDTGKKLINYINFISNIDMNFRLKPQTGHSTYTYHNRNYNLRISSLIGKGQDTIVIRILNNHKDIFINNITTIIKVSKFIERITNYDQGLFVISGSTGSGKSTSLYAIIDEIHRKYSKNIITIEDPIEINKDYCLQIELNEKMGITYNDSLKQILRHDPDVIMIGEIRDSITAKLALTCALTGHLVLTTIHAGNCLMTIKRLLNLEISSLDLQDVLVGVLCQKMRFDKNGNRVIVPEYVDRDKILLYLENQDIDYFDFDKAKIELQRKGIINE